MRKFFTGILVIAVIISTLIWANGLYIENDLLKGIAGTASTILAFVDFILLMVLED